MDRRSLLSSLFQKSEKQQQAPPTSLAPYTGVWGFEQAAHLLRRATFGPTYQNIHEAVQMGLEATITKLFDVVYPTEGPIHSGKLQGSTTLLNVFDPNTEVGSPWVQKEGGIWKASAYDYDLADNNANHNKLARRQSLRAWKKKRILDEGISILEQMSLFWHNHLAISQSVEPIHEFRYLATLQDYSLGSYKEIVKYISTDPLMLQFLNSNVSTAEHPNQNYARELLELFSIGKGPLIAPGDYTNYTEEDIVQAARVLTGWVVFNPSALPIVDNKYILTNTNLVHFNPVRHDTGIKTFSAHFGGLSINNANSNEYLQLIDLVFEQAECARYLSRELYLWFVYYDISPEIEASIIEPMAQMLISNNYQVQPTIAALLKSEHFFDMLQRGAKVKNPFDFVMSVLKPFAYQNAAPLDDFYEKERFYQYFDKHFQAMQMIYLDPPDVAGWKAYYQAPNYYRSWINATTLSARNNFVRAVIYGEDVEGVVIPALNVLEFITQFNNPADIALLVDDLCQYLLPREVTQAHKDYLIELVLGGLPAYEWTVEYTDFLADPLNMTAADAIQTKLRALMMGIMNMPEFQLS